MNPWFFIIAIGAVLFLVGMILLWQARRIHRNSTFNRWRNYILRLDGTVCTMVGVGLLIIGVSMYLYDIGVLTMQ